MSMSVVFRLGIKRSPPIPFRPALELRFLAPLRPGIKYFVVLDTANKIIYIKLIPAEPRLI